MKMTKFVKMFVLLVSIVTVFSVFLVSASASDECEHTNVSITYEAVYPNSHWVTVTCNDCGHVTKNITGCQNSPLKTVASPIDSTTHYEEKRCADCNNLLNTVGSVECYYVINGNQCICGKIEYSNCTHSNMTTEYVVFSSAGSHYIVGTCTSCYYQTSEIGKCSTIKTISTPLTSTTHRSELRCADCNGLLETRASEDCYFVIDGVSCACGNYILEKDPVGNDTTKSDSDDDLLQSVSVSKLISLSLGAVFIAGVLVAVLFSKKR